MADRWAYSPFKDLGAAEWLRKNPTYDGRGVTIAVLDGFVDFLLPELQEATTLDGKPIRKVMDVLNSMIHWIPGPGLRSGRRADRAAATAGRSRTGERPAPFRERGPSNRDLRRL